MTQVRVHDTTGEKVLERTSATRDIRTLSGRTSGTGISLVRDSVPISLFLENIIRVMSKATFYMSVIQTNINLSTEFLRELFFSSSSILLNSHLNFLRNLNFLHEFMNWFGRQRRKERKSRK